MSDEIYYAVFSTTAGWIGILGSANGLRRTTLPEKSAEIVRRTLGDSLKEAAESPRYFANLIERYRVYFDGRPVEFPDRVDFVGATSFQQSIWQATRRIPFGETRSYAWVAAMAGNPKAARAAGQALNRNPLPIIVPCHRVLGSDGALTGFGGGLKMKGWLLSLEENAKVNG